MLWKRILFFAVMIGSGALLSYLLTLGYVENMRSISDLSKSFEPDKGYIKVFSTGKTNLNEGILYRIGLRTPMLVHFYITARYDGDKWIELKGDKKIVGVNGNYVDLLRGNYPLANDSFLLREGSYEVIAQNPYINGNLTLYISNEKPEVKTVARLLRIDSGDLDNPPSGLVKVYSASLNQFESTNAVVYEFRKETAGNETFSVYARVPRGRVSVKLQGRNIRDFEFINEMHPVCDQFTTTLEKGDYRITITADHPGGEVMIFRKKNPGS